MSVDSQSPTKKQHGVLWAPELAGELDRLLADHRPVGLTLEQKRLARRYYAEFAARGMVGVLAKKLGIGKGQLVNFADRAGLRARS